MLGRYTLDQDIDSTNKIKSVIKHYTYAVEVAVEAVVVAGGAAPCGGGHHH